ncbi:hypothetical protein QE363_002437 [Sphingomonas sp. SORGH_AS870]|nr:hypothetical protein [Sphingomonas sp. SORGH_AS_0870]
MAHRSQGTRLFVDQSPDPRLHPVEGTGHVAHLLGAALGNDQGTGTLPAPQLVGRAGQRAERMQDPPDQRAADKHQRDRRDQRQQHPPQGQVERPNPLAHPEAQQRPVIQPQIPRHHRGPPRRGQPKMNVGRGQRRLPIDDLAAHAVHRRRDGRAWRGLGGPADDIAVGGQFLGHFGAFDRGPLVEDAARDDQMLGQPPCLVVTDRDMAGALVEIGGDGELDRHRQQQDRDDPAEQADRGADHRRSTGTLSM